jgi:tetratricopeptide (TPR) repeat protein
VPGLGLVALVLAGVVVLRRPPGVESPPASRAAPEPAAPAEEAAGLSHDGPAPPPLPAPSLAPAPPVAVPKAPLAAGAAQDQATADRLADQVRRRLPLTPQDGRAAESLYSRYPGPARDLLEAVLLGMASQERARRQAAAAAALLERAATIAPQSPRPRRAMLDLDLEAADWPAAEAAARALLRLAPDDAEATRGLAYALVRLDRADEALSELDAFLAEHSDPATRAFRDRIAHDRSPETGLDERRLAHFHVRYDGQEHEEVGREILRALERHYATLVLAFGKPPSEPVPVVLLSRESYYDATGAPAWAGGHYDFFDGRVRIPIGGLTASLTPDLDATLIHELTHAFVADLSRGLAPREIQEGLAQMMEGKSAAEMLGDRGMRALADGRVRGVAGFYVASLSLVEYLVSLRGRGGVNDLLAAMAETGSADGGFRRVYGKDFVGLQADWAARLRLRYGS